MNKRSNCIICSKPLRGRQTKFCSAKCHNRAFQSYEAQKSRGLKRKLELVDAHGGACEICGYKKNLSALAFHHNAGGKEFQLDVRSLSNRTFDKVEKEVAKCRLLCQNCHHEIHNPELDLAKLLS